MNRIHRISCAAVVGCFIGSQAWAPPQALADFEFVDLTTIDGINIAGDALQTGAVLRIVPAAITQTGAAWFATRQQVSGGFDTTFQFQLSNPAVADGSGQLGGDGFAFVIQTASAGVLSDVGGFGLGYQGIPSSIAVEFDTWLNGGLGDPTSNHVGVMSRADLGNQTDHATAGLALAQVPGDFNDGVVRSVRILYDPNVLSVFIDDLINPILTVATDLDGLLALDNGGAFVGFTAATGGAYADHDILSWSFTASGPGCEVPEDDPDGDGVPDCFDGCPNDAAKIEEGLCGCGVADTDTDADGVADCLDNCPNTANSDQADSDGDALGDACESPPVGQPVGDCGCGVGTSLVLPFTIAGWFGMRGRYRRQTRRH